MNPESAAFDTLTEMGCHKQGENIVIYLSNAMYCESYVTYK